jgi:hypothetical protein
MREQCGTKLDSDLLSIRALHGIMIAKDITGTPKNPFM